MCGICGVVQLDPEKPVARDLLTAMTAALSHRGPDGEGLYLAGPAGFGHRRLAIIDLDTGRQPLSNEDRTLWLTYNGELYNFRELRARLERAGHRFATRSDTEVIVHAYEEYGEQCLEELNGMFAFALWDARRQKLLLARDRMGIKPLYYAALPGGLVFASEPKAILVHPEVPRRLDPTALRLYLALEYVPTPHAMFADLRKLPPGHYLTLEQGRLRLQPYWDLRLEPEASPARPPAHWAAELRERLRRAVNLELVADVPVGVLLSGGLDSGAVAAMMVEASSRRVPSFTMAFDDPSFDESAAARRVARHLGTEHHEFPLAADAAITLIPEIFQGLDEPLGDSSLLPTFCLARFTRRHLKVALGGDGGDELFGGYPTLLAHRLARYYQGLVPEPLRRRAEGLILGRLPVSFDNLSWDFRLRRFLAHYRLPAFLRHHRWLGSFTPEEQNRLLMPEVAGDHPDDFLLERARAAGGGDPLLQVSYGDFRLYLEGDILAKVDRAGMAHALEVRVPLLNRELVEFARKLPLDLKVRGFTTKYLLRRALRGLLPEDILRRPKKGFNVPMAHWLAGPLRPLLLELLSPTRLKRQGLFIPGYVQGLIREHLEGRRDHRKLLWTLVAFQLWYDKWARG
jgi:asparagine synthase (glutamine-hydrolysing)